MKIRALRVRTLDGSIKTVLVDDSNTVAELTKTVCARIGKLHIGTVCIGSVSVVYRYSILPCVVAFCSGPQASQTMKSSHSLSMKKQAR